MRIGLIVFVLLLLRSCATVTVDSGPFDIQVSAQELSLKEDYLATIQKVHQGNSSSNVLLILVDDLGKYDISVYSDSGIHVPHIESLAQEGVTFMQAYSTSPVCSPSRAGVFTGRYQQRFGFERQPMNRYANNNLEYWFFKHFVNTEPMRLINPRAGVPEENIANQGIPTEEILLPEIMQSAGYSTGLFGKWHMGFNEQFKPIHRGFDYQYGFYEAFSLYADPDDENIVNYRHDYFANKHIWRQKRKGTCAVRINDMVIEEDEYLTFAIANRTIDFMEQEKDHPFFAVAAFNAPHTPFQVPREYYDRFADEPDPNKRVYYGMIAALDDAIGMLLENLERNGLDKNTIVIFASDNGGATYTGATDNGPLKAGKFSQFEGGINIPMIIKWPSTRLVSRFYDNPVMLTDIFATVCSATGIELPAFRDIDGKDLLSFLTGDESVPHQYLYWRTDYNKAIRSIDWKLIWNTRDSTLFLYNMKADNFELRNVASEYPGIVEELQREYNNWEEDMIDPLWPGVMEFKFDIDGEISWWTI